MPDNYWIYLRSNYQSIQESASVSNQFMLYVGMIVMIAGVFIMYFVSNQYIEADSAAWQLMQKTCRNLTFQLVIKITVMMKSECLATVECFVRPLGENHFRIKDSE